MTERPKVAQVKARATSGDGNDVVNVSGGCCVIVPGAFLTERIEKQLALSHVAPFFAAVERVNVAALYPVSLI